VIWPRCKEMSRRLSAARDEGRPLTAFERLHLWACETCRRLRAQFALLGLAAAVPPQSGPALSPEAKARMRGRLSGGR
jgi:hypothetical protein